MTAPFSKMDFILILNFMEDELKFKEDTIEELKKWQLMSQANETKYGKISPHTHHHLPATTDSPSSKSNTKKKEVVNHDCMDPMLKLDKLIESHQRCVQDDLRRKLMTLNDVFYMETEKQLTKEQKQEDDEGGDGGRVAGRIDELIDEVRCLSKNLDSLRGSCQSRKDEMSRIIEEQLLLDPNKNVALVIMPKLISARKQHYEDLKVVCNNIHQHETRLAKVKMKVKVLEESLVGISDVFQMKNRKKREEQMKLDELNDKITAVQQRNSLLQSKIFQKNTKSEQQQLRQQQLLQHCRQSHIQQKFTHQPQPQQLQNKPPHTCHHHHHHHHHQQHHHQHQQQLQQQQYISSTAHQMLKMKDINNTTSPQFKLQHHQQPQQQQQQQQQNVHKHHHIQQMQLAQNSCPLNDVITLGLASISTSTTTTTSLTSATTSTFSKPPFKPLRSSTTQLSTAATTSITTSLTSKTTTTATPHMTTNDALPAASASSLSSLTPSSSSTSSTTFSTFRAGTRFM